MRMYEVTVTAEDMRTQVYGSVLFAEDEDDALDRIQRILEEQHIVYGMCQASEM